MLIKKEENASTDCFQGLSNGQGTQETASGASNLTKIEHTTTANSADQPLDIKDEEDSTFGTTQEQVPMSMPLQDDLCLTAMEATIQSVFDALNVLSQQQQQQQKEPQPYHQQPQPQPQQPLPLPPSSETGLQASSQHTSSSILAQISLPSSTLSTMVPTVGKVTNKMTNSGNSYPVVTHQPVVTETPELSPAELLKQQMMKQKVRSDNRERKQRWRINNEERNKDNDLRCRVNKRAQKLFGMEPSEHKKKWVDEEFERRRAKRQEKERRKQAVNGALAATPTTSPMTTDESDSATISQLQHKLLQHYQSLFGMDQQDSEKTKNSTAALVAALQNPQLLQLSQLLAQTVTAGSVQPQQTTPTSTSPSPSPSTIMSTGDIVNDSSFLTTTKDEQHHLDQSKIDLAAAEIMKQFTSHALDQSTGLGESSSTSSFAPSTNTTTGALMEPVTTSDDTTMEEAEKDTPNQQHTQQKKNDYPMDAVMTLMELNAGWRP
ncbi:hypothetical protein BC941DRAFT_440137 [Chlamydoabsidia padenii]|nr:hypothetical protein BC941DRAFT_440137 [Chlamydoabsidia padenii]